MMTARLTARKTRYTANNFGFLLKKPRRRRAPATRRQGTQLRPAAKPSARKRASTTCPAEADFRDFVVRYDGPRHQAQLRHAAPEN
ncbi:MAG: hypothetical protein WKG07_41585 [Hymenobacter sp.]